MLFENDLLRLSVPGRSGYPVYDVDVISPELPCGVAWLATALLALGVPLWQPWGIDDSTSWERETASRWRYRFAGSGWSRLIPMLVDGHRFRLRPWPVPRFTHAWAGLLPRAPRTILFVRDPRDALYSEWQREQRKNAQRVADSFSGFLRLPFRHLPVDYATYAQLFWRCWLIAGAERPCLILRFEDCKRDPHRALTRAVRFLGLRVSARARAAACHAARHEHAAAADQALSAAGIGPRMLGDGTADGWRTHFTPAMSAAMGSNFDPVCDAFGYARCVTNVSPADEPLVDPAVLARAIAGEQGPAASIEAALRRVGRGADRR